MPSDACRLLRQIVVSLTFAPTSRHYWHLGIKNSIRSPAVGRRRWLVIGHPDVGWRSAVIYTFFVSCPRRGINPQEYLTD